MAELQSAIGDAMGRHQQPVDSRQTFRKSYVFRKSVRRWPRRLWKIRTFRGKIMHFARHKISLRDMVLIKSIILDNFSSKNGLEKLSRRNCLKKHLS